MTSKAMFQSLNPTRSLAVLTLVSLTSIPGFASTDLIEEAHFTGTSAFFADSTALNADGNVAVFGSVEATCLDGDFCGAAYVYRRIGSSWTGPEILTADSPEALDFFGHAVDISGDGNTILASAPNARCPDTGLSCGAAYLFVREGNTWGAPTRLVGDDTMSFESLGRSAALSADGSTALVGQPDDPCSMGIACGAGYVFKRDNSVWTELTKLIPSAPTGFDLAGAAVALSGDASVALLGSYASGCSSEPSQCGSAYVFSDTDDGWSEEKHLLVPQALDPAVELEFGFSVSLSSNGETALIGANCPFFQVGGLCAKRTFIYSRSGGDWLEQQRLAPANGDPDGRFGYGVSISADSSQAMVASSRAVYLYSAKLFTDGFESGDTSVWSLTVD